MAKDLICGMAVDEASALRVEVDGQVPFLRRAPLEKVLSTLVQSIAERGRSGDGL